jgi:hypothetical protein
MVVMNSSSFFQRRLKLFASVRNQEVGMDDRSAAVKQGLRHATSWDRIKRLLLRNTSRSLTYF